MKKHVAVIIVAGGSGTRFKSKVPKAFVLLKGKPLLTHSLKVFEQHPAVTSIVIVGHKDNMARFESLRRGRNKIWAIVPGGKMRADSVKCGLAAIDARTDIVLVHDAARPLVDGDMVHRLLDALKKDKAAIVAVPVKATIKSVDPKSKLVKDTPRRDLLWDVQTPQGFHKDVLLKAHAKKFAGEATDDAMMVERLGVKVRVVMGDYHNIKITTPEDLKVAAAL